MDNKELNEQKKREQQQLLEKWEPVINLDGEWAEKVGDAPKVTSTSKAIQLAEQLESLQKNVLEEKNVAGDVAVYNPVLIPLVRRVIPSLIGPEIFGTQNMKNSTGLIFYLRSLYTGTDSQNLKYGDSSVLTLSTTVSAVAGTTIEVGGVTATVVYVDSFNGNVLCEGGFTFDAGAATIGGVGSQTVSAVYNNENMFHIILPGYTGPHATSITSPATTVTGGVEYMSTTMNEMGFTIESDTVTAQTRKLKARWSRELEEDMKNAHNLNAEQILTSVASDEIVREMNREFVLKVDALTTVSTGGSLNVNTFTVSYGGLDGRWELEKYQNLCAVISRIRRNVAIRNKRGQATWMIVTPLALSILEATGKLSSEGVDPVATYQAGTFMGMKVFVDLYASDTTPTIWLGYKGSNEVDAGYFYCPYIPLSIDKGVGPEDNIPRLFFRTRYGMQGNKFGAEKYYAKITLNGFPGYTIA